MAEEKVCINVFTVTDRIFEQIARLKAIEGVFNIEDGEELSLDFLQTTGICGVISDTCHNLDRLMSDINESKAPQTETLHEHSEGLND